MKPTLIKGIRALIGLAVGLELITAIAEGVEFLTVGLINGRFVTDPSIYLGIRNRPPVLVFKLIYNSLAAFAGGYVAAWIARGIEVPVGAVLALLQLIFLAMAIRSQEFGGTGPKWMWIALMLVMTPAIAMGAWTKRRRTQKSSQAQSSH